MEESLSKFMSELEKRHEENSNMIKEIRASIDAAIRNQRASIKTLEIQIEQISKLIQPRYTIWDHLSMSYPPPKNSKLMFETRQTTISFPSRLNDCYYEEKKGSYGPQLLEAYSYGALHIDNSIPQKEKDPISFTLPCYINNVFFDNALADLGASVSVMPLSTYLNLGLGELAHTKLTVELVDRTVKYIKGIAKNVLVGIELRRDQVDDLMPTIEEGKVIKEVKARNDNKMIWILLDEGMGEVVVGKPFCEVLCVETRRFLALRWHLEEIHVTWTHLEKKQTRLLTYTKYHEELLTQSVETAS
ncbi:NUDIX hydrolase 6-like protein [Tanacetum coccineum]